MRTITRIKLYCTIYGTAAILVLLTLIFPARGYATQVHLTFFNEQGKRIRVDSAELLLTAWGRAKRFPLPHAGDALTIVFDKAWIKQYWKHRMVNLSKARVLLRAAGYAPVLSDPFSWIHDADHLPHFSPNDQTRLTFPGSEGRTIHEGQSLTLPVIFFPPRPRTIVLIDDEGSPLPNIRVAVHLFWSRENHCAVFYDDFPVGEFISDRAGRVTIPRAGRGSYIVRISSGEGLYCLKDAVRPDSLCRQAILQLDAPETMIQLRPLRQITFDLVLKRPESLQTEILVLDVQIETACAFGGGRIGKFHASEPLTVKCYPERIVKMWIASEQENWPSFSKGWLVNIQGIQHGQTYVIDLTEHEQGGEVIPRRR